MEPIKLPLQRPVLAEVVCSIHLVCLGKRGKSQRQVSACLLQILTLGLGGKKEEKGDVLGPQYMWMYPYWLKYPFGWNYPAACVSGGAGRGGWAASIDPQASKLVSGVIGDQLEIMGNGAATCAGCTAGCTYVWGD
jgi:hypothetical protein